HLDCCVLNGQRNSKTAPGVYSNDRTADPSRKLKFEVNPITVCGVHSCDNQEDISRAHLVSKLELQVFVAIAENGIVFGNTQIVPPEEESLIEKPNNSPVVAAIVPSMANEDLIAAKAGHRLSEVLSRASVWELPPSFGPRSKEVVAGAGFEPATFGL